MSFCFIFFFKQKTAYEMRISDWSSDVCSSDLQDDDPLPSETVSKDAPAATPGLHLRKPVAADGPAITALIARCPPLDRNRSEERRVGNECVSTCRSRWSPYH